MSGEAFTVLNAVTPAELGVKRSSASLVTSVGFNSLLVPSLQHVVVRVFS